jgi:hypothetical protein
MGTFIGTDRRRPRVAVLGVALAIVWAFLGAAVPVSASDCAAFAIYTTDPQGQPVNANIYDAKEDVYLNGGPDDTGTGAGETYYYQVFAPDGTVLSPVRTVVGDDEGQFRVQLAPYNDTTNNGGEYKVIVSTHPAGSDGTLLTADTTGGCVKSDNFKVKGETAPTPTPVVPTPTPVVPTPTPVVPTPTPTETIGGATPTPTIPVAPTPTPSEIVGGATPTPPAPAPSETVAGATPTPGTTPPQTSTETPMNGSTGSGLLLVLLLLGLGTTGILLFSPARIHIRR